MAFSVAGCADAVPPSQDARVADYPMLADGNPDMTPVADCLRERGYPVSYTAAPGEGINVEGGLPESVFEDCVALVAPPEPEPLNEDEMRGYFEALVESGDCLRRLDLALAISEPPSFEVWRERYLGVQSGEIWTPYLDVMMQLNDAEEAEATAACPEPRTAQLFGG
ncbi:hypothetical protein [Agrococcus beijingensis]|uniref:hypothetical protein n=1 Tax=Agrococcus beijingensis TaxID=3068634 RepID=UPI0027422FD1|nr:hypothetical protein [Agrococcus sp. REN33]